MGKASRMGLSMLVFWVLGSGPALAGSSSDPLIQEFNDAGTGVAFSMLSKGSWESPGRQNFHRDPTTPQKRVQAVTISNATKKIMPYQGDTRYGLVLSVAERSGFYQYFATKSAFSSPCPAGRATLETPVTLPPAKLHAQVTHWAVACAGSHPGEQIALCGRCVDGGACAGAGNQPDTPSRLWPALGDQVPYAAFQGAKNAIVEASGAPSTCPWASAPNIWNEFNTNGLSPKALAGVLVDQTSPPPPGSWVPADATLCGYLRHADPSRSTWPVYALTFTGTAAKPSALTFQRTLSCP